MKRFISLIIGFFRWWYATLLSCLPQSWSSYFGGIDKNIDLVIVHQGNTVFIQTEKGKIIDSITLKNEEVEKSLNADGQRIESNSNVVSLQPLNIAKEEDVTIFDDDDKTTQYLDINSDSDEDTVIILNEKGLSDHVNTDTNENTLVFHNDGGRIRQVQSSSMNSDVDEIVLQNESQNSSFQNYEELDEYEAVARLLAMYQSNKKCLYLLPDNKVFTIILSYPIQVIQNIESVLRFDLEKHIPISLKEVRYFYALNINSAQSKVSVEVAVIKLQDFDLLNSILEPYIDKALVCTTDNFFKKFGKKINFVEKVFEQSWYSIFKVSNVHLLFNSALLLLLLALPYYLYQQYSGALIVNTSEEMKRVQSIISSMNSISAESKFWETLSQQISDVPRLTKFLSIMSEEIDQQAWLSRYSFKNNEIRIKGEAVSATAVSDELSDTGLFESIKFVSSIIKNARTDKESFELLLRIKSGA